MLFLAELYCVSTSVSKMLGRHEQRTETGTISQKKHKALLGPSNMTLGIHSPSPPLPYKYVFVVDLGDLQQCTRLKFMGCMANRKEKHIMLSSIQVLERLSSYSEFDLGSSVCGLHLDWQLISLSLHNERALTA